VRRGSLLALVCVMEKLKKNRRGGAAIEFALLLPVMMSILLGIMEYGLYFNERQLLQNILNETCGETFYTDAEEIFIGHYDTCWGCDINLADNDTFYFCTLDKEHNQYTGYFPPGMIPAKIVLESVRRKTEEQIEAEAGY